MKRDSENRDTYLGMKREREFNRRKIMEDAGVSQEDIDKRFPVEEKSKKVVTEAKSEKDVAKGMQKKGYNYILLVKGKDALYAKTTSQGSELMRTDLKNQKVDMKKIDAFLGESIEEGKRDQMPAGLNGILDPKDWPTFRDTVDDAQSYVSEASGLHSKLEDIIDSSAFAKQVAAVEVVVKKQKQKPSAALKKTKKAMKMLEDALGDLEYGLTPRTAPQMKR